MNRKLRTMAATAFLVIIGSVMSANDTAGPYDFPVPTAEQFEDALKIYEQSFVARQLTAAVINVHASIARLRDNNLALAAGYAQSGNCRSNPEGALGIPFAHEALIAGSTLDPLRPQLLWYEPEADGALRFIGVTYLVDQRAWHEAGHDEPPKLFRQEFHQNDTLSAQPAYALHLWLGQFNPNGLFAT